MDRFELLKEINDKYKEIAALRKKQVDIAKKNGLEEVENYTFTATDGSKVALKTLFGEHDELILIHNMGKSCSYCALWADGFSSSYVHLATRCGFALTSPDDADTLKQFAEERGWEFPYFSAANTTFTKDMGFSYLNEEGKRMYYPGYTTFLLKDNKIYRVACDTFGPYDFYSPIWHFMEMLYHGERNWTPRKSVD